MNEYSLAKVQYIFLKLQYVKYKFIINLGTIFAVNLVEF